MAEKTELLEEDEKVVEIELERLRGFENHPFKVRADSQMIELQESIKKYGILNPLIVRPKKDGCYEIISGHRRKFAAEKIRWAKKYNVKQFAESILFLQQHDIHDKETLDALVNGSSVRYHELMKIIKDAEEKMAQNKVLKTHIINYAKTRDTYIAYRKSGYSKKFYEAHRDEIILHKAAKEAFSKLTDGKIPKVRDLNEEFARLLSEKKAAYSEYKK